MSSTPRHGSTSKTRARSPSQNHSVVRVQSPEVHLVFRSVLGFYRGLFISPRRPIGLGRTSTSTGRQLLLATTTGRPFVVRVLVALDNGLYLDCVHGDSPRSHAPTPLPTSHGRVPGLA